MPRLPSFGTKTTTLRLRDRLITSPVRTIRRFAEDEIVIPTGRFEGQKFRCERQPWAGLWLDAIDSHRWRRHFMTGASQGGKSLAGFVIPTLYHLFELRETVICGVPSLDLVADKWEEDLLPAIAATRYRDLLPRKGRGAKGGVGARLTFGNGATLRFMTAGGSDKSRASFTSRVLVVTETDGFDSIGKESAEASKFEQLEARLRSFLDAKRVYAECTVSTKDGRTWTEIQQGTRSLIALRCPHCAKRVTPEREHLTGWADAPTIVDAVQRSRLTCPACGVAWSENDRKQANADATLVHRGQVIDGERIDGQPEATDTLGFRWSAANNLLVPIAEIGGDEWKAAKEPDEAEADRKMCQFVWAVPPKSLSVDLTQLDAQSIMRRTVGALKRGFAPADTVRIAAGADIGKRLTHWTIIAERADGSFHVVEYGRTENPSDELGDERGVMAGLRQLRDEMRGRVYGEHRVGLVVIDEGFLTPVVHAFVTESGPGFVSSKGVAATMYRQRGAERETGSKVLASDAGSLNIVQTAVGMRYLELDADAWKSRLHGSLTTPLGMPGAMTLFVGETPQEHTSYAKHLTAERKTSEFVPNRGEVIRWKAVHQNNHWLDSTALGMAALKILELTGAVAPATPVPTTPTDTPVQPPRRRKSEWMSGGSWL
jgi:phage terminase large subunit GpA-like protein